jgi:ribonucleoside-diphosphate reductase alpha chain
MNIARRFTTANSSPFASTAWVTRSSKITNPDGSVVFQMDDALVPESWSQLATDIMVSKYFRKAGVPQDGGPNGIASDQTDFSSSAVTSPTRKRGSAEAGGGSGAGAGATLAGASGSSKTSDVGPEKSAAQVIHRLAGCWRHWGEEHGYFASAADAQAFYDELVYMMVHQMAAPNSPQWFNTGLNWAYGLTGPAQGHFVPDPATGEVALAADAYTHPQPHACFIQSISDDLVNEGGIMDLWVREARLFKYGSGTGTNFSNLRGEGEKLSGGGKSSGLMSWLKIGDRAASAIKSGGTTRRAAKMVCLDMDHPDIEDFVNWKVREEIKVQAMVEGLKVIADKKSGPGDTLTIGETARKLGLKLDYDFNGEAYLTVSGQNSNNSVRIGDDFFKALDQDAEWKTYWRIPGKDGQRKVAHTYKARELWDQIGYAAWRCADPGVQFDTTINAWHTCPGAGRINASNPCSEYMFLDNTACNLASINVLKFYNPVSREFDWAGFEHAIDLWTVVLEISVLMAAYPSKEVAQLSWKYRTLGLGYANLGAMLMQAGISYDSHEARAVCACLSAILTGRSYRQSAVLASEHGPFPGFAPERENMLRVIRNHRRAAHGIKGPAKSGAKADPKAAPVGDYENLSILPVPIDHAAVAGTSTHLTNARDLAARATLAWDEALALGEKHGYRNAQSTVIAPTGTIGLLMDCDTTGIEPDFALVKFKKLAGGGYFKIANASVKPALEALGYSPTQIRDILVYLLGALSTDVAMPGIPGTTFAQWLKSKGLTDADLKIVNDALPGVFEVTFAFNAWTLGDDAMKRLGIDPDGAKADPAFNLLRTLGLSKAQIAELNELICGTQTIEGAPHLKPEHVPVFDCANKCGKKGKRFIHPHGHIRMMAAAQPFISGAISKTINLPNEATVPEITECYRLSWELGLKANALYRDGCKLSQPLSSTADDASSKDETAPAAADTPESQVKKPAASVPVAAQPAAATPPASSPPTTPALEPLVAHASLVAPHASSRTAPRRRRLPDTRASITHKFKVANHEGYLTVGLYEDGMPGELFITMAKEGSTIGGLMDSLGTATSVALQYGVPIQSLVTKFTHQRFEPAGMTGNADIPFAKSLVDYIFRWLGMEFIPGYREENAPKRGGEVDHHAHAQDGAHRDAHAELHRRHVQAVNTTRDVLETPSPAGDAIGRAGHHGSGVVEQRGFIQTDAVHPAGPKPTMIASVEIVTAVTGVGGTVGSTQTLSAAMASAMGDAPACDGCGAITVRSGTCYKCLNCGQSAGCS